MGAKKAAVLSLVWLAAACGPDSPEQTNMPEVTSFTEHESTAIGARLTEMSGAHPGESGFAIIRYGQPALAARIAMADLAEKADSSYKGPLCQERDRWSELKPVC